MKLHFSVFITQFDWNPCLIIYTEFHARAVIKSRKIHHKSKKNICCTRKIDSRAFTKRNFYYAACDLDMACAANKNFHFISDEFKWKFEERTYDKQKALLSPKIFRMEAFWALLIIIIFSESEAFIFLFIHSFILAAAAASSSPRLT